jgi:hypothetical protein
VSSSRSWGRTLLHETQNYLFSGWDCLICFMSIFWHSLFSTRYPKVNQNLLYDARATQNYVFSGFAFCEGCMSIFFCPLSSPGQDKAYQNHAYDLCMPQHITSRCCCSLASTTLTKVNHNQIREPNRTNQIQVKPNHSVQYKINCGQVK